jgi:hypothetical protein
MTMARIKSRLPSMYVNMHIHLLGFRRFLILIPRSRAKRCTVLAKHAGFFSAALLMASRVCWSPSRMPGLLGFLLMVHQCPFVNVYVLPFHRNFGVNPQWPHCTFSPGLTTVTVLHVGQLIIRRNACPRRARSRVLGLGCFSPCFGGIIPSLF